MHEDPEDGQPQAWPVKVVKAQLPTLVVPFADPTGSDLGLRSVTTGQAPNVGPYQSSWKLKSASFAGNPPQYIHEDHDDRTRNTASQVPRIIYVRDIFSSASGPGYCEAWIVLPNTHNNAKLQQAFKVSAIVGP
jgi:hypothetical protein